MRTPEPRTKRLMNGDMCELEVKKNKSGVNVYFFDGSWRTREGVMKKLKYKKGEKYKREQAKKALEKRRRNHE